MEERQVEERQEKLKKQYLSQTTLVAVGMLRIAYDLMAWNNVDPESAMIQANIRMSQEEDMRIVKRKNETYIVSPGYKAFYALRKHMQKRTGFQPWIEEITHQDIRHVIHQLHNELTEFLLRGTVPQEVSIDNNNFQVPYL